MKKSLPLGFSLLVILAAFATQFSCTTDSCGGTIYGLGQPLFLAGLGLAVVSIGLLFASSSIIRFVSIFSLAYWVIAGFIIAFADEECRSMVCLDRELTSWWLSGLFVLISVGIIIYKKIREGKAPSSV